MDKLSELFKEAKNRLSNPLFFSFLLSWLITNWRIPVALLGYSNKELRDNLHGDYLAFISAEASWLKFFVIPLGAALFYTFLFPIINAWVLAFHAHVRVRSDNKNTEIMKDYYVPMTKFMKQKNEYKELSQKLMELYKEDEVTLIAKNEAEAKVIELRNEVSKISDERKDIEKRLTSAESNNEHLSSELTVALSRIDKYMLQDDVKVLDGKWIFKIDMNEEFLFGNPSTAEGNMSIYELEIFEGNVVRPLIDQAMHIGKIIFFNYNYFEKNGYAVISVISVNQSEKRILHYQIFQDIHTGHNDEIDIIKGVDGNGNQMEYIRMHFEVARAMP